MRDIFSHSILHGRITAYGQLYRQKNNGRQGQLRIFWNGLNTADIRLISVLRHALLKIRPRFTDRKRNGKYLKIPMRPLLTVKHGNLYRSLEATSADQTVQAKSAFFQDYSIVPTAGKNCIIA